MAKKHKKFAKSLLASIVDILQFNARDIIPWDDFNEVIEGVLTRASAKFDMTKDGLVVCFESEDGTAINFKLSAGHIATDLQYFKRLSPDEQARKRKAVEAFEAMVRDMRAKIGES